MGVLGLPHALSGALLCSRTPGRFGGGSGVARSVGGAVWPALGVLACFSACQSPVLKCISLEAPALVAAMAAALAEEILRGRAEEKLHGFRELFARLHLQLV